MYMSLFSSKETGAAFKIALKMRYQTAFFYLLSGILMFVCLGLIYNLDNVNIHLMAAIQQKKHLPHNSLLPMYRAVMGAEEAKSGLNRNAYSLFWLYPR